MGFRECDGVDVGREGRERAKERSDELVLLFFWERNVDERDESELGFFEAKSV